MDGITVLNTYTSFNYLSFALMLYGFGLAFILVFIMIVMASIKDGEFYPFVTFVSFGVGVFLLVCGYNYNKSSPQTRYQITVDDSVSFNDFMERYEIIGQDGKIYTIIEKEE